MRSRNHFRIVQRKRYDARRFHNPYFRHQGPARWKAVVLVLGVLSLGGVGTTFFLGSSYFAIKDVFIAGTESISADEIRGRALQELNRSRLLFFHASNRFLYNESHLREALSTAYTFESLDISTSCQWREGGCSLSVSVKEKTSQLLWISDDHAYLVDLQGVVIRELTAVEVEAWQAPTTSEPLADGTAPSVPVPSTLKRLPVFADVNAAPVTVGSVVLTPEEITNLFQFQQGLARLGVTFNQTRIDRLAGKWMAIRATVGYDILVDASGDMDIQLGNLEVLLRDTLKDTGALQYIDLRFGDHVYYK